MSDSYDFSMFLARAAELDYSAILKFGEDEAARTDGASFAITGAPARREAGSVEYLSRIKAFLFFMRHQTRPGSADDLEFQSYRPVVEALVQKQQFKPEALILFKK